MSRVLPILFNGDMVNAILDDRKTATRRLINPRFRDDERGFQVLINTKDPDDWYVEKVDANEMSFYNQRYIDPPYQQGDILYVRETWKCWRAHRYEATADIMFKADGNGTRILFANGNTDSANRYDYDQFVCKWYSEKWHPSIHMPKEAARIWLKVTDVKPERLHDMTLDDFLNEGIVIPYEALNDPDNAYMQAKRLFIDVWDSTVNKEQRDLYEWSANPWVWAIKFERIEKPEE